MNGVCIIMEGLRRGLASKVHKDEGRTQLKYGDEIAAGPTHIIHSNTHRNDIITKVVCYMKS